MEGILNGKIFLNEERGFISAVDFERRCSFNFGGFYNEHKEAFGTLLVFNDELLGGRARIEMVTEQDCYVVLLPVAGNLSYHNEEVRGADLDVGQLLMHHHKAGEKFIVINKNEGDAIRFLQIWIKADETKSVSYIHDFEYSAKIDTLMPVTPVNIAANRIPFNINIGTFEGRGETVYKMKNTKGRFFCFVLAGAFEVQGRLMHALDGLGLWEIDEVEMEALSNNAVILVMEL